MISKIQCKFETLTYNTLYIFKRLQVKINSSNYIKEVIELEKALSYNNLLEMNKALGKLKEDKTIKENINDILDLLIIKLNSELAQNYSKKINQIEIIEECRRNLKRNSNFDITLDCMMIKLWELESV